MDSNPLEQNLFTNRTNARLTFILGTVLGITMMTLGGAVFFLYVLSGGNVGNYTVEPLTPTRQLLAAPIKSLPSTTTAVVIPGKQQIFGAKQNPTVTIIEYVDYECPFCKLFFPTVQQYVTDHKDKVRLIIKQYPLVQIHPNAEAAAIAAECASQQNKLADYSSALFNYQANLSPATYTTLAKTLQLDTVKFNDCIQDPKTQQSVQTDSTEAINIGVRTQPNLVIWHNNDLSVIDGYVDQAYLTKAMQQYL